MSRLPVRGACRRGIFAGAGSSAVRPPLSPAALHDKPASGKPPQIHPAVTPSTHIFLTFRWPWKFGGEAGDLAEQTFTEVATYVSVATEW